MVARVLSIDRQNICKSLTQWELLDSKGTTFWTESQWCKRSDTLDIDVTELVLVSWTSKSTVSPNRKDIIQCRVGVKKFEEHKCHNLQVSQDLHFYYSDPYP